MKTAIKNLEGKCFFEVQDKYGIVVNLIEIDENAAGLLQDAVEDAYRQGFREGVARTKRKYLY